MNAYDFLVLSPHEFEGISRDILQEEHGVFIESFTTGRDGGIDLRFARRKRDDVIIQAKRYKDFKQLYGSLKKEFTKVSALNPSKYILTTSVGLTPANKDAIKDLLSPYIHSTSDILGKDDLNNLLSKHHKVELKYYKLWLSSTNILDRVLHSKVYNQSAFELEDIQDKIKLYVQNESFNHALDILNQNKYVIISGIPGIGKSTLARILILYALSTAYDEFVFLNDSIDEGYEFFKEERSQVFFFDDFLGKNFFEARQSRNEDNKIVKFLEKIKRSKGKILILATREYILKQATLSFESFKSNHIEIAKCVLDLSSYTKLIKAQIIYNHLFFAEVPVLHLEDLLKEKKTLLGVQRNYQQLIDHKNYNPRIIETVIERKIWEHCGPEQFTETFKTFLDNPQSVWYHAFENSLDKFSQYALIVLLFMGTPVRISDWESALEEFLRVNSSKYWISYDSIKFHRAIKELESTFIKTDKDPRNTIIVEYQNPSIQDFLVNYLRDKYDLIRSVIDSIVFTDQFFSIFSTVQNSDTKNNRRIFLSVDLIEVMINRLKGFQHNLRNCTVIKQVYTADNFFWAPNADFIYGFLEEVYLKLVPNHPAALDLVYANFQAHIYWQSYSYAELKSYLNLLNQLDLKKLTFDPEKMIAWYADKMWMDGLELFPQLGKIFPEAYDRYILTEAFIEQVKQIANDEIDNTESSDLDPLKTQIESIEKLYGLSLENELADLERREQEYSADLDFDDEAHMDMSRDYELDENLGEDRQIEEIFNSLVDRDD